MPRVLLLTTAHSYRNEAFQNAARRLGIEVVQAVDATGPLVTHTSRNLPVDFGEPDAAVATIAGFAAINPLAAILAVDDSGVVLASEAAAVLGLPHNQPGAAHAARNKYQMRRLLAAAGVPSPWHRLFSTADDPVELCQQVPYPCVIKPLTLNGSRGVIRANAPAELISAALRLRRLLNAEFGPGVHPYLVEAFIPGFEVALEGMLDDGQLVVLALFDKPDPLDGPFFEETIYVTPSRLDAAVQTAIADAAGRAAAAIGLKNGPIHAELRVNARGPWLLEIAGRSIGGLCGQTLRFDLGVSLEELILRQACGLPWQPANSRMQANGVMMIPIPEAGILERVDGIEAATAVPFVESIEITAPLHHSLIPLPEGDSYLGFIFAEADTPEQVESALRAAHAQLRFGILAEFNLATTGL
ncbi:MAG: ATP-grasp domain-containing protein [Anaerolineales bacterium]|nr:ATP-grasp domain-containing protein [Anaerolineales bacterium]